MIDNFKQFQNNSFGNFAYFNEQICKSNKDSSKGKYVKYEVKI